MTVAGGAAEETLPSRERPAAGTLRLSGLAEFGVLLALSALVHALVSALIYPGVYDPLWPNHSDYYIASDLAHRPDFLQEIATSPRPLGYAYLYGIGHLGTRGSILASLLVVFANCTLTAMFVRRFIGRPTTVSYLAAVALYVFLVFAHPLQHVWSTYDGFSQLAYLLMMLGLMRALAGASFLALTPIFLGSFLVKETYILSLMLFLGAWWATGARDDRRSPLHIAAAAVIGFGLSVAYSKFIGSIYLGAGATAESPYHIVVAPASVLKEWTAYASEGLSRYAWTYVGLSVLAAFALARPVERKAVKAVLVLAIAGLVAWLPNALLPNHHMAGYAWNGAYLLFVPVLLLAPSARAGIGRWAVAASFAGLGLLLPLAAQAAYKANSWVIAQQTRQQRVMSELRIKLRELPQDSRRVLVTGLSFPFSPFDHPWSLEEYRDVLPRFSVVAYQPREPARSWSLSPVRYVSPAEAIKGRYDTVWSFAEDGSLTVLGFSPVDEARLRAFGVEPAELALYPAVGAAFLVDKAKPEAGLDFDAYHLLSCGTAYLVYEQFQASLTCLRASQQKIPDNPYPYFYIGEALGRLGRLAEAQANYQQAIARDDPQNRNPAFQDGLDYVSAQLSAGKR